MICIIQRKCVILQIETGESNWMITPKDESYKKKQPTKKTIIQS